MKAIQVTGYGEVERNVALAEVEMPIINRDQVLIEVHSASVNPIDYKIVQGALKAIKKMSFPTTLGFDVAGVVKVKGADVINWEIDDKVYARVSEDQMGTFAEFIAVDSSMISAIPKNVDFSEAASIPLVGLTTVQGFEKANLQSGDKVLIHAGSGGVGVFAIQYAKSKGAFVYTTTSTDNVEWVKKLGANVVIDYKKEDYLTIVKEADVVFDTLGGNYTSYAFKVLKKGGFVISIAGDVDDETAIEFGLNRIVRFLLALKRRKITKQMNLKSAFYKFFLMHPSASQLDKISVLIESGAIKPVIDKEFDLIDAVNALLYQKSGRAKGKVILKIK